MKVMVPAPVRAPRPRQSAAEKQAVYEYVTDRDGNCRAPIIDPAPLYLAHTAPHACIMDCTGPLERHHAGNTTGSKRITDARHVVLLCEFHHRTWAPSHSRLILEWLAQIEDARERARHDAEEDARTGAADRVAAPTPRVRRSVDPPARTRRLQPDQGRATRLGVGSMTGLWRTADHVYYCEGIIGGEYEVHAGPFVSVTSALRALDKSGPLVGWATRETAAAAIRNLDVLQTMVKESSPEAAQKWLQTKPGYIKDTAADLGSRAHLLAEAIANGQEISQEDQENPKIRQYLRFIAEWQPRFVGVEMMVVNFSEAYAGTADIWAWLDGDLWLLDIKTGKGTYPDMALQLAALHNAEWSGAPDKEMLEPSPKATRFGILHLQDEGYDLIEYQVTDADYQAFLAIKTAHSWLETRAKEVVLGTVKRKVAA